MAVVVVAVAARHLGARARRAHEPLRLLVAHARRQVRQREVEPDAHAGAAADDRGLCLHRRLGAEHLLDADVCRELVRRRRRVEGVLQEQAQRELGGERLRRARDLVQLGGGGEVRGHVDPLGLGAHRVPHAVVAALAARVRVRRVAARRHAGVSLVPAVDLVGLAHRRLEAPAGARWRGRGVNESGAPKCAQVRRIAPKCAELRRIARRTRRRPRRRRPACSRGRESSATAAGCGPTTSRRRRCGRAVGFRPSRAGVAPASAAAARGDSGRAAARRRRGRAAASCRPARGAARGTCRAGAPPARAASAGGAAAARGRPWSGRGRPRGSPALGRPGARGRRRWEGGGGGRVEEGWGRVGRVGRVGSRDRFDRALSRICGRTSHTENLPSLLSSHVHRVASPSPARSPAPWSRRHLRHSSHWIQHGTPPNGGADGVDGAPPSPSPAPPAPSSMSAVAAAAAAAAAAPPILANSFA